MVKDKDKECMYGEIYYKDLEFAYKMFEALYEKYSDEEIYDRVYSEVHHI